MELNQRFYHHETNRKSLLVSCKKMRQFALRIPRGQRHIKCPPANSLVNRQFFLATSNRSRISIGMDF